MLNVANAPGNECHAGKLAECLKMISGGLPVDYVGATGVEMDAGGTANGSYAEREVIGGAFTRCEDPQIIRSDFYEKPILGWAFFLLN